MFKYLKQSLHSYYHRTHRHTDTAFYSLGLERRAGQATLLVLSIPKIQDIVKRLGLGLGLGNGNGKYPQFQEMTV